MPATERQLEVLSLSNGGTCLLARNAEGVAIVTADDLNCAHSGLGYCHARDRGMQMLLARLIGQGRACEQLQDNDEMLALDRFMRHWNFAGDAALQEAALSVEAKAMAEGYCLGVNLYYAKRRLPWELRWLGYRFEPWNIADIFLMAKLSGLIGLAQTQGVIERFIVDCVQNGISRDRLEALFPGQLQGLDEELLRHVRLQEPLIPAALKWASALPTMMASNNWVVAGRKTVSGKPFLCNDPHLEINRLPAVWYEAVLRWPSPEGDRYAMGGTMPGLPAIVFGRTAELAWGVTYAFMDTIDSWIEECRDGKHRRGDVWHPFVARKETVRRKKSPPQELIFYDNDHGVLEGNPLEAGFYLSTRWSCGEGTSAAALEAARSILTARTVEAGRGFLGTLSNASWNWVLADRDGNIGYQMSGRMPRRRQGISGLVPLPGWDPANDWQGFEPPENLPRVMNPPEGFIATANEDRNHLGTVRPINVAMAAYRAERIRRVLKGSDRFTLEDMQCLQLDLHSIQAEQLMAILRPTLEQMTKPEGRFSQFPEDRARLLANWDLAYTSESQGAFVFEQFYRALFAEVFGQGPGSFGPTVLDWLLNETYFLSIFFGNFDHVLLSPGSPWFGHRSRAEIYRSALAKALAAPPEPYGRRRRVRMLHLLLGGKLPHFLGFDRAIELLGNRATVHQGQICRSHGRVSSFGPSLRLVTDLATDEVHTSLPGGPSDRRFSKWYVSDLARWLQGRYKAIRGR